MKIGLLAYTDMAEIVFAGDPYLSFVAGPKKSGVAPRKYGNNQKGDTRRTATRVDPAPGIVAPLWGIEDSFRVTDEQVDFAHVG